MDNIDCGVNNGGSVLERLEKVNSCLDKVSSELLTVTALIKKGFLSVQNNKMYNKAKDMEVISVYERDEVSVLSAKLKKGCINAEHNHINAVEYIICLNPNGKLELITPSGSRFCTYASEVVVTASEPHKTIALEDTDILCVCVPKEKDYASVLSAIKSEGI